MLAFAGISIFVQETGRNALAKLDWFGFGMLSLGIASLQIFLDRGEQLDWFASARSSSKPLICSSAFYVFLAHTFTAQKSFVNPESSSTETSHWGSSSFSSSASPISRRWR